MATELRKIDLDNLWEIIDMDVKEDQQDLVFLPKTALAEAYAAIQSDVIALPFAFYDGDTPVGFIMFGYGDKVLTKGGESEKCYCIWHILIGRDYQGMGYGKKMMQAGLDYLGTKPCGEAGHVWLSFKPWNSHAKHLYESFGFVENGMMQGDEAMTVREL